MLLCIGISALEQLEQCSFVSGAMLFCVRSNALICQEQCFDLSGEYISFSKLT